MKIKTKIMFSLLLVSLSGIVLVSGVSFFLAKKSLIHARGEQLHAVASSQKNNIMHVLEAWKDRLNLITSGNHLRRLIAEQFQSPSEENKKQMEAIFLDAVSATRGITFLEVCDLSGGEIVTTRTDKDQEDAHCEEVSMQIQQTKGPKLLFWEKHDDRLDAVMIAPFMSLEGKIVAILLAHMATQEVLDVTKNYDGLGKTGETLVVKRSKNGDAEFLTPLRHDSDNMFLENIAPKEKIGLPITQALLGNEVTLVEGDITDYRGMPVLAATAYIPELDLGLVAKIDRQEALQSITVLWFAILSFVALITIAVIFIGVYISRSLAAPIVQLANIADKVKEGDLSQKIDVHSKDEVGHLATSFHEMIKGLNQKIQQEKYAQKELGRFKKTLDQTHDCVFMFDPDTFKFTYSNQGALLQFGYEMDELKGMAPYDIKPDFSESQFRELIEPLLNGEKETLSFETVYQHKQGHLIPVEINLQYINMGDNEYQFVAIVRDIVERKNAKEKLQDSEQYIHSIMDTVLDTIITIDDKGTIEKINNAVTQLFGYEKKDLIGKNVKMLMPESYAEHHDSYIKNYLDTGDAKIIGIGREAECQRADGSIFSAKLAIQKLEIKGKTKFVGTIHDVTEQKKRELAEREREKMQSLASLAGGLAHEINNALQPVLGLSEAMRDRFHDTDEKISSCMNTIYNNTMHARNIVRDVLSFARKEQKQKEVFNLCDLVKGSIDFADEFIPSGVTIDLEQCDAETGSLCVSVDQTGMVQIMANLFKNASHAMADKGVIKMSYGSVDIDETEFSNMGLMTGQYAKLTIADSGCGMDKETLEHIFEPFYTTKPVGVGTGLGLSAVYGIVREWGGTITVESERKKGTSFAIYIPLVQSDSKGISENEENIDG